MLKILLKISLIARAVSPAIDSMPMLHIILVVTFIAVSKSGLGFPMPKPISHSIFELPVIDSSIIPTVSSFPMELSQQILSLIPISILKLLITVSTLHALFKSTLVGLIFAQN